jgi:hypothetical protein
MAIGSFVLSLFRLPIRVDLFRVYNNTWLKCARCSFQRHNIGFDIVVALVTRVFSIGGGDRRRTSPTSRNEALRSFFQPPHACYAYYA